MARQLDITGDVCPMTFVKVKMALGPMGSHETLSVRLREEALKNVISSVKSEGHRIVRAVRDEPYFVLEVEKAEDNTAGGREGG